MESGADFQKARDAPVDLNPSSSGFRNPAQDLQQRALSRSVPADDAHDVALLDLEGDVLQCPECLALPRPAVSTLAKPLQRSAHRVFHHVAEAIARGTLMANDVALPEVLDANDRRGHE